MRSVSVRYTVTVSTRVTSPGASFEIGMRRCERVLVVSCAANDAPNATSTAAAENVLDLIRNVIDSPFEVVLACPLDDNRAKSSVVHPTPRTTDLVAASTTVLKHTPCRNRLHPS